MTTGESVDNALELSTPRLPVVNGNEMRRLGRGRADPGETEPVRPAHRRH